MTYSNLISQKVVTFPDANLSAPLYLCPPLKDVSGQQNTALPQEWDIGIYWDNLISFLGFIKHVFSMAQG